MSLGALVALTYILVQMLIRKRGLPQAAIAPPRRLARDYTHKKGRTLRRGPYAVMFQPYCTVAKYAIRLARSSTFGKPAKDIFVPGI